MLHSPWRKASKSQVMYAVSQPKASKMNSPCSLRARVVAFCVLMACITPVLAADECSGEGAIEGRVVDSANQPVANVQISFLTLECAVGGLLGRPVRTDVEGGFRLTGVPAGLTAVCTSKPEHGYHDTSLAFYGADYPPTRVVVHAGKVTPDIVIRLKQAEIVTGKILDEETSQPLLNAWIRVSRVDSEGLRLSLGPNFTGDFRFLLPPTKVRIEIRARGYEPWLFTGLPYEVGLCITEIGSYVSSKSFGTRHLEVRLRKLQN
jgi:hypothetical protein